MKTFCCTKFQSYYENGIIVEKNLSRELYPNIKIIKLERIDLESKNVPYRYLFICGFLESKPPFLNIAFCPFCGQKLSIFYDKDEYVNDSENNVF
jgi:hypothetical protein